MKKGFLVYFDNCKKVNRLPDGPCAAVWRAATRYAERVAGGDAAAEDWLAAQLAPLPPEAVMAAEFMADTILRDDQRYREKTEYYRAAQGRGRQAETATDGAEVRKYMERLRRERGEKKRQETDDAWKYI